MAEPEALVSGGVYTYVPNPMYIGVILSVLGQAGWWTGKSPICGRNTARPTTATARKFSGGFHDRGTTRDLMKLSGTPGAVEQ